MARLLSGRLHGTYLVVVCVLLRTLERIGERCIARSQPCTMSSGGGRFGAAFHCPPCMSERRSWTCRVLVSFDRHISFVLGRPCAIQDEE
jgi:hypothetical protein